MQNGLIKLKRHGRRHGIANKDNFPARLYAIHTYTQGFRRAHSFKCDTTPPFL